MNPFDLESEKFRILFGDLYQLADKVDESAREIGRIVNVMHGSETGRGVLWELETIRDSIAEGAKALEPIIGAALPAKIEALKRQFDEVPGHILKAASSVEFHQKLGEAMVEAAKPAIEQAQQAASYSVSAHVHGEVGKAVAAAVNEHLAESIMTKGYIGKLEGQVSALKDQIGVHVETIKDQKNTISVLSSGKVNRWLIKAWFLGGAIGGILASSGWEVFTTWVLGQPIPFPLPWR